MSDDDLPVLLGKRFIERRDVKAVQHSNGIYTPDRTSWKMQDLRDPIAGTKSLGHYMVSQEGNAKLFAFDLDLKKEGHFILLKEDAIMDAGQPCNPREIWKDPDHPGREYLCMQLRCMAEGLAIRTWNLFDGEYPVALSYSGNKGLHVYCFTGTMPASDTRGMALEVLKSFGCFSPSRGENFFVHDLGVYANVEIEVFPKQDNLEGKDLGNLMRLPLGRNLKSGNASYFLDCACPYTELRELDPVVALNGEHTFWKR